MSGQHPMDDFEARVREALRREGDQIRPEEGLDGIRERTATPTRRRTWLMAGAVGIATATAIAGAFFVSGDLLERTSGPDNAVPPATTTTAEQTPDTGPTSSPTSKPAPPTKPSPTSEPSATPSGPTTAKEKPTASTPPVAQLTVPVYYLGETTSGPRLFREFHVVESSEPMAVAALNEMLRSDAFDPDYGSPWAGGSRALSVDPSGGQITVNLSREVLDTRVPRQTADLMVQQLVYTVQAALQDAASPVRILVEGEPVPDLAGSPTSNALARADEIDVQAMTWIIEPFQSETVPRTFKVTGLANAFEASVAWQLLRGGEVVRENFTTAQEGQTFSEYSFRVQNVPPGRYTLKVFQPSAEDGSQTFVDTKDITVD